MLVVKTIRLITMVINLNFTLYTLPEHDCVVWPTTLYNDLKDCVSHLDQHNHNSYITTYIGETLKEEM